MLFRTRRSRARYRSLGICRSRAGRGIGGGLELRGVGWCDGAGVVPGVDIGGRVELYVSAEDGISESVSIGDRCRSCSADLVSRCEFHR